MGDTASMGASSISFTLVPVMQTPPPPRWSNTRKNSKMKLISSSRNSEKRSRLLSLNLKKVTDAIISVTSKSDVVDFQEEVTHDHVFDSHHHHATHTNLMVCALSTLTGTVVLTTASEPAQQNRRFAFLTTTNTSKKSIKRRLSTKLTSTKRLLNGQNKSKNGRSPLWPVLNPRSHVSTQRVIAVLLQLQLKLKSTERDVKLKPSFGSSQRPLNLPVKLLLLKIRSSTESAAGIPQLRLTS